MGNSTLNLPAEEPTPCWTCAHFGGHSAQPALICDCADRASNFYGDPARLGAGTGSAVSVPRGRAHHRVRWP